MSALRELCRALTASDFPRCSLPALPVSAGACMCSGLVHICRGPHGAAQSQQCSGQRHWLGRGQRQRSATAALHTARPSDASRQLSIASDEPGPTILRCRTTVSNFTHQRARLDFKSPEKAGGVSACGGVKGVAGLFEVLNTHTFKAKVLQASISHPGFGLLFPAEAGGAAAHKDGGETGRRRRRRRQRGAPQGRALDRGGAPPLCGRPAGLWQGERWGAHSQIDWELTRCWRLNGGLRLSGVLGAPLLWWSGNENSQRGQYGVSRGTACPFPLRFFRSVSWRVQPS